MVWCVKWSEVTSLNNQQFRTQKYSIYCPKEKQNILTFQLHFVAHEKVFQFYLFVLFQTETSEFQSIDWKWVCNYFNSQLIILFLLLRCEYLVVFFVFCDVELNILGFFVGRKKTKQFACVNSGCKKLFCLQSCVNRFIVPALDLREFQYYEKMRACLCFFRAKLWSKMCEFRGSLG